MIGVVEPTINAGKITDTKLIKTMIIENKKTIKGTTFFETEQKDLSLLSFIIPDEK